MIKVASIQFNIKVGDVVYNTEYVFKALSSLENVGLAVLPEMWTTGFSYKHLVELSKTTPGIVERLKEISTTKKLVIIGSMPEEADTTHVYNTIFIIDNGKLISKYKKIHLFSQSGCTGRT